MVLSNLELVFVLMLRPFFPKLVMSTDLLSFEHTSVLLFSLCPMFWFYRYNSLTGLPFFRSYSELLSKFSEISFQENVSEGISHPVFYGDPGSADRFYCIPEISTVDLLFH